MRNGKLNVRLDTGLESLLEWVPAAGIGGVLATVVATAGSTYRKPGARMLILPDGSLFGLLSGGCLESDLGLHAAQVLDSGRPRAVEYDMRGPDDLLFGIGAGCEGAMRVLLEVVGPATPALTALTDATRTAGAGRNGALVVVHDSNELKLGTYGPSTLPGSAAGAALRTAAERAVAEGRSHQAGPDDACGGRAFVQFLAPPPHVLICGAGPDAVPVADAARKLGWRVTVADHRPAYALARRFPGAEVHCVDAERLARTVGLDECHAAVVMSHHLSSDISYLRQLAEADGPDYVGLLGPAARRQRLAEELGPAMETLRPRLRGPVGIDIGAVTPEGIALSIVSQIHAALAARERA